jgi:hypothetical protein
MAYLHGINRPDLPARFHLLELPAFLLLASLFMARWGVAGAGAAWALRAALDSTLLFWAAARCGARTHRAHGPPPARTVSWTALLILALAGGFALTRTGVAPGVRAGAAVVTALALAITAWYALLDAQDRARVRGAAGP